MHVKGGKACFLSVPLFCRVHCAPPVFSLSPFFFFLVWFVLFACGARARAKETCAHAQVERERERAREREREKKKKLKEAQSERYGACSV